MKILINNFIVLSISFLGLFFIQCSQEEIEYNSNQDNKEEYYDIQSILKNSKLLNSNLRISYPKEIFRDVSYGSALHQKFDAYRPANLNTKTPAVILLHSGGWIAGDKTELDRWSNELCDKGVFVINMNYSLEKGIVSTMKTNAQKDIKVCVDFVRSFSSYTSTIDLTNVTMMGLSAGGHLSLLHSTLYNSENHVNKYISLVGPVNLCNSYYINKVNSGAEFTYNLYTHHIGGAYSTNQTKWKLNDPYIQANNNPKGKYMIVVGQNDLITPPSLTTPFVSRLRSKGKIVNYKIVSGYAHYLDIFSSNQLSLKNSIDNFIITK